MVARLTALLVFVGVLGVALLAASWRRDRRRAEQLSLAHRIGPGVDAPQLLRMRDDDTLGHALGGLGLTLHHLLARAGVDRSVSSLVVEVLALSLATSGVLSFLLGAPGVLAGLAAGLLPFWRLQRLAKRRNREIVQQLPDALDLIARALRSGHAFGESLRLAATELPDPLRGVLLPASEEHRLGLGLREVLAGVVHRVPGSFEVRLFASSVMLHRDTGGNLIEILEQLAETVRERIVFDEKVKALTAEVRVSARILEALPVLAAAVLLALVPTYLEPLIQPGLGRTLLVGACLSMGIGVLVMRRIAQVHA